MLETVVDRVEVADQIGAEDLFVFAVRSWTPGWIKIKVREGSFIKDVDDLVPR